MRANVQAALGRWMSLVEFVHSQMYSSGVKEKNVIKS